ncbi:MAG: hypothetical protein AB8G15_16465 [Saprospiraceae bacterium]
MEMTEVIQKIQLIEGQFTPSEASDLVSSLIKEKINFHKIQRLSQNLQDECCDTKDSKERIEELTQERKIARNFISEAKVDGKNVRINCVLEITYEQ